MRKHVLDVDGLGGMDGMDGCERQRQRLECQKGHPQSAGLSDPGQSKKHAAFQNFGWVWL